MVRIPAGFFANRIAGLRQTVAATGAIKRIGVAIETTTLSVKAQGAFGPEAADSSAVVVNKPVLTIARRVMSHTADSTRDGGAVTALPFAHAYFETLTRGQPSVVTTVSPTNGYATSTLRGFGSLLRASMTRLAL